jgi:hypothetical protein
MNAEITNDQAEELAGMANKPRPIAYAKPFIVLRRGLIMQHIAICNHEGHGYTIPIYTEAPQTALSQPAAVEGWKPLTDTQWLNIVNQDHAYDEYTKDDAVHKAVRLTEARLRMNNTALSTSPLLDKNDQTEGEIDRLIDQRDNAEEWADRLANAIAQHFDVDVGEHSSLNNPWNEALTAIESPPKPDSNELVVALAEARRERDKFYGEANIERQNSAELKANSDRYLFLRNQTINEDMCPPIDGLFIGHVPQNVVLTFEHADAAIDAALAQSPSKKGGE